MSTPSIRRDAKILVDEAMRDGPCDVAYADLLQAYIAAPLGGRDALFLEIVSRFALEAGSKAEPTPTKDHPRPRSQAGDGARPELEALARSALALVQALQAPRGN